MQPIRAYRVQPYLIDEVFRYNNGYWYFTLDGASGIGSKQDANKQGLRPHKNPRSLPK